MKIHLWPLCLVRWVPGEYLNFTVDTDFGRVWFTRGQVRFMGLPVVSIAQAYSADQGLLAHELEHVGQFWRAWWYGMLVLLISTTVALMAGLPDWRVLSPVLPVTLHPMLYTFSRWYRLRCEAKAYRVQMNYPDRRGDYLSLDAATARLFSPSYDLRLTLAAAVAAMGRA